MAVSRLVSERAVFLDKDGTLVPDVPHNVDPAAVEFYPDVAAGLRLLREADYRLIIVSNQSGIAHGYFDKAALDPVREKLEALFRCNGVELDAFFYCPHSPEGTVSAYSWKCYCRKPMPGMLLLAARKLGIDLKSSWMVGDILNDVEAGRRAGCRTVLLDRGNETEWKRGPLRAPTVRASDFREAAEGIVGIEPQAAKRPARSLSAALELAARARR